VEKDEAEGVTWLERASKQGYRPASDRLQQVTHPLPSLVAGFKAEGAP
jgi:hypothetical protein